MTFTPVTLRRLPAAPLTPETFHPFGQAIFPTPDGTPYGPRDAQLKLDAGTPRFYIMQLLDKGRRFHKITRHQQCTQCLGALESQTWYIAVAPPSAAAEPDPETIRAFRIPGHCFIKLHVGTWHAGPLFDARVANFYNLELSDTNLNDHQSCDLRKRHHLEFEVTA